MPSEGIIYLHTDHLLTNRLATDATRKVIWRWEGEAFGNTPALGSVSVNLRFPGQYYDAETNLHYNHFRYYDPELGRYITSDPIGLRGGMNTYNYVRSNPLKLIDLNGLEWQIQGWEHAVYPADCNTPDDYDPRTCNEKCDDFQFACEFGAWTGGLTVEILLCEAACLLATGGTGIVTCAVACAALGGLGEAALLAQCAKTGDACRQKCEGEDCDE